MKRREAGAFAVGVLALVISAGCVEQSSVEPPVVAGVQTSAEPPAVAAEDTEKPIPFGPGMNRPRAVYVAPTFHPHGTCEPPVPGVLLMECTITSNGEVKDCQVIKPLPKTAKMPCAFKAMAAVRVTPVLVNGRPTPVRYVFTIRIKPPLPPSRR